MKKENNRTQFINFCCEMVEKYGLNGGTEVKDERDNTIIVPMEAGDTDFEMLQNEKVGGGY